jgi:hypothetical protein
MIFLYQTNGDKCLTEAIRCAARFVPLDSIVLIGDREYVQTGRFIPVESVAGDFARFDSVFVHSTVNSAAYEKECFHRWFAGLEAMKMVGVDRGFFMDSDCLLCCDPFATPHSNCDYSLGSHSGQASDLNSAGVSFQSVNSLSRFMEFVFTEFYGKGYGGSDMHAWTAFHATGQGHGLGFSQMSEVRDGCIWDMSIGHSDPLFIAEQGLSSKVVFFEGGLPFSVLKDGRVVRLLNLHLWALYKERMRGYNDFMDESLKWVAYT